MVSKDLPPHAEDDPAAIAPPIELHGVIDGFRLPACISGWVIKREGGRFATDLRVEVRRGKTVLIAAAASGPREDVTGDSTTPAAFMIDCNGIATGAELLDGSLRVVVVDGQGDTSPLEFYAPTRAAAQREIETASLRTADASSADAVLEALTRNPSLPSAAATAIAHARRLLAGASLQPQTADAGATAIGSAHRLHRRRQHRVRQNPAGRHPVRTRTRGQPDLPVRHRRRTAARLRGRGRPHRPGAGQPGADRGDHGSGARAGRGRLCHQHDPGRRLPPLHRHRFRHPQALRPAPDHRRYAGRGRHHAWAAHHSRAAGHGPRNGAALPRCAASELREPDGDELLGAAPREPDPDDRAVPQRAGHGGGAGAGYRRAGGRRSTTPWPASTTWRST